MEFADGIAAVFTLIGLATVLALATRGAQSFLADHRAEKASSTDIDRHFEETPIQVVK